ncbi:hypothetical protein DH86_00002362 [Scytalidium sp. 3C]|nr:hypothetical protein DH86_00002362 [Scytalidium sp. 3C]
MQRHLARHKEKDDEAGGEGLGVLATRKRLWRDENGNIVNSRRPSLADAKEIARKRMENRRNSESAAAAAAKTTTAAQVELGTVQAQSQRPQSGMLRQAQHQMQMKRERPQHLKTRSLGRIPTAHHPISIQTQQQMYMHQSNIRSPIEDFPDYMQQQQHSWGNGIHSPPLSVPSLSVGGSSYSNSSSTGTTPSSEHDPADESDRAKHHLLTPPLESNSWPDLQPHIPLFTASPSPENFEYPSPGLHSQPWSNNPSSATPFSHYPPTQQSHDVLHYDGLDLDLDLEIFKQDPDNDDRLGSVDWAVPPEQVWHTRERPFGCGAGSGGLGPRGLGFGSAC